MTDDELKAKLLSKREIDSVTDCWVWTGAWDADGYGVMRVGKQYARIHKLAARLWLGKNAYVLHRSGCPRACFNPDHLTAHPTRKAMAAAYKKAEGFQNGRAILTPFALELIKDAVTETAVTNEETAADTARRIAEVTGLPVTGAMVRSIAAGESWTSETGTQWAGWMKRTRAGDNGGVKKTG